MLKLNEEEESVNPSSSSFAVECVLLKSKLVMLKKKVIKKKKYQRQKKIRETVSLPCMVLSSWAER